MEPEATTLCDSPDYLTGREVEATADQLHTEEET
jgi:hypothetical protein